NRISGFIDFYIFNTMKYENVQIGWFFIAVMLLVMLSITVGYYYQLGDNPLPANVFQLLIFIFSLVILNFYRLKIKIDETGINLLYGIGLIHININPDSVEHIKVVRTSWLAGFGIRITLKGVLYNIQSRDAVQLAYTKEGKNKTVSIGCRNPEEMKAVLQRRY